MADWKSRWRSLVRRRDRETLLGLDEEPAGKAVGSPDEYPGDELASDDVAASAVDSAAGAAEPSDGGVAAGEAVAAQAEAAPAPDEPATDEADPAVVDMPTASEMPAAAETSAAADAAASETREALADAQEKLRLLESALLDERARRERLEREVAGLSDHDPLTGLASARRFNDRLGLAVTHALRQKHKLAIVQLGIDRFDSVREAMGPSQADDLLRSVALALESTLRQGDTIARLGSDPVLTVLLPGVKHDDDVTVIADKLRLALRSPFTIGGSDLLVTASIGMALFPDDGSDTDSLLQGATLAMERAREKGGDAWDVHAPGSRARAAQRQARETALQRALVRGGLQLYWQPVVTCDSGAIAGVESLLRWRGGERAPVASDFVTLTEVGGLAVPLGQWLLRAACRQLGEWRRLGYDDLVLGVSISARQLAHTAFVKLVRRVLDEGQLAPANLELAIASSELAASPEVALERLGELRALGIRVALDAFGASDSRLGDPHRFPLDSVRIDPAVVRDAVASADHAAVIRAAIALARSRKLRVIAAGAETEAQRGLLVRLRCEQMFGRLSGAPMPAPEAERLLRAWRDLPKGGSVGAPGRRLL